MDKNMQKNYNEIMQFAVQNYGINGMENESPDLLIIRNIPGNFVDSYLGGENAEYFMTYIEENFPGKMICGFVESPEKGEMFSAGGDFFMHINDNCSEIQELSSSFDSRWSSEDFQSVLPNNREVDLLVSKAREILGSDCKIYDLDYQDFPIVQAQQEATKRVIAEIEIGKDRIFEEIPACLYTDEASRETINRATISSLHLSDDRVSELIEMSDEVSDYYFSYYDPHSGYISNWIETIKEFVEERRQTKEIEPIMNELKSNTSNFSEKQDMIYIDNLHSDQLSFKKLCTLLRNEVGDKTHCLLLKSSDGEYMVMGDNSYLQSLVNDFGGQVKDNIYIPDEKMQAKFSDIEYSLLNSIVDKVVEENRETRMAEIDCKELEKNYGLEIEA